MILGRSCQRTKEFRKFSDTGKPESCHKVLLTLRCSSIWLFSRFSNTIHNRILLHSLDFFFFFFFYCTKINCSDML